MMDCFRCTPKRWMSFGETLVVKAFVIEGGTGEEQDTEASVTTAEHSYNHRFQTETDSFVPGLPFAGSLTVTKLDGTPAITELNSDAPLVPNVTVEFCSTYSQSKAVCENDSRVVSCTLVGGKCDFEVLVPFHAERVQFDVQNPVGNYPSSPSNQLTTYTKRQSESKTKSFLRVKPTLTASSSTTTSDSLVLSLAAAATANFTALHWHVIIAGRLAASGVAASVAPTCIDSTLQSDTCTCRSKIKGKQQKCTKGDSNSLCSVKPGRSKPP